MDNKCVSTRYCAIQSLAILQDQQTHPISHSKEVLTEAELMDISILDDLPDIMDVPEKLSSDFDFWSQSVLGHQWLNDI